MAKAGEHHSRVHQVGAIRVLLLQRYHQPFAEEIHLPKLLQQV